MTINSAPVGFLDRALDLALGIALGDRVALVVLALALCQRQLQLDLAVLVVQPEWDQRVAAHARLGREPADLPRVQQEFARPPRLVVPAVALFEQRDVGIPQPDLAFVGAGVGVAQVDVARANRLDFRAQQGEASLDGFEDVVVVVRLPIARERPLRWSYTLGSLTRRRPGRLSHLPVRAAGIGPRHPAPRRDPPPLAPRRPAANLRPGWRAPSG